MEPVYGVSRGNIGEGDTEKRDYRNVRLCINPCDVSFNSFSLNSRQIHDLSLDTPAPFFYTPPTPLDAVASTPLTDQMRARSRWCMYAANPTPVLFPRTCSDLPGERASVSTGTEKDHTMVKPVEPSDVPS